MINTKKNLVLVLLGLTAGMPLAHAQCVTGFQPQNPDSIYVDHGNGTVTDTRAGLMWQQCPDGRSGEGCAQGSTSDRDWAEALGIAEASQFAGYTDWRLPNTKELFSLVETCRTSPMINTIFFPSAGGGHSFWSSTPTASGHSAWFVSFHQGLIAFGSRTQNHQLRLVRGGHND